MTDSTGQATAAMAADVNAATSKPSLNNSSANTLNNSQQVQPNQPLIQANTQPIQHQSSAETTINLFETPAINEKANRFSQLIPDAYKEKEWVQNLSKTEDPTSEFFKQYEHAQSMIGRGPTPPGPDATPEQTKAFYKQMGVPDDIKAYTEPQIQWAPEDAPIAAEIAKNRPVPFMDELKQAAMEAGVTPAQYAKLVEKHDRAATKFFKEQAQASAQADVALNEDFGAKATRWFGADKDAVMARGQRLLSELVAPELKGLLAQQSNDTLMLLASAMNGVHRRFIAEDGFRTGTGTSSPVASGVNQRQALVQMMQSKAFNDAMHPEHDAIVKRVNEGYKNLPKEATESGVRPW